MTQNGQFHLIHNFSNLFLLKWLRMANSAQFATFPIFFHQSGSDNETVYTAPSPMEWYSGNSVFQISVGTWSSTWMMIFTSWQSRLFVMEIVTLQLNLTNYTYLYTLDHNFVTIHPI